MRIVYLATADARGHLMRAQLLTHALRRAGLQVDVWTTSEAGRRFLAAFGVEAALLSPHYAVQFDARQNMRQGATDRTVASYMLRPDRMARDLVTLWRLGRGNALVVNDSFHPALLCLGALPGWRNRVVHVYGASLRRAVEHNFDNRLPPPLARAYRRVVGALIDRAQQRVEHDFGIPATARPSDAWRLPTPVAVARRGVPPGPRPVAVYLNPHFRDPALARALIDGLHDAGCPVHCVGEGYAALPNWHATDDGWIDTAAHAPLIVAAPGMAALSVATVYRRPILLLQTSQPEQRDNAARAAALPHQVVTYGGDPEAFRRNVATAARTLLPQAGPADEQAGIDAAEARLEQWVAVLRALAVAAANRRHRDSRRRQAAALHA